MKKAQLFTLLSFSSLVILGGITLAYFGFPLKGFQNVDVKSKLAIERNKIVALGRLEPKGEILAIAGPAGTRIAKLKVKEGDWVEAEQILAYLETYQMQKSQRDLAASRVQELESQLQANNDIANVQIKQAAAQVEQVDQPQFLQTQSQEAQLRSFEAELENAEITYNRFRQLYAEGAVSREELEQKELALRQAQQSVKQAQETLQQLIEARATNLKKAKVDLAYARSNLAVVESQSGLASAREELKLREAELERTIIRAPQAGKILKIYTHPGEAIGQQGVLQMGNTRQMQAIAEVYETDIQWVKVGQTATVISPAFKRPITGKVAEIGQLVFKNDILNDDPAARSDVRVIEAKINLDQSEAVASLSQIQVDVEINLDTSAYAP